MHRLIPTLLAAGLLATPALAQPQTAASVIARYDAWRGGTTFAKLTTLHESGALTAAGLTGVVEVWGDATGRVRQDQDLSGFKGSTILGPEKGWTTSASGQVQTMSPIELRQARREGVELLYPALHNPPGGTVSLGPPETLDGEAADVVRVAYADSSRSDYLITPAGELLAIRNLVNGQTSLTRYSDWRTVQGVKIPSVEATTGEQPTDASTARYAVIEPGVALKPALFNPPIAIKHVIFDNGAHTTGWLPFEAFSGNSIYIPAQVNGHPVTVLLDSGAETSVLDSRFASQIGLTAKGAATVQGTGGASTAGLLTGVDIRIGVMTLSQISPAAIDLSQVEKQLGRPLPVILGAEIFQDAVIEIDFPGHRIAFHDPETYRAPAGAVAEPVSSANGIHTVPATIEGRRVNVDFDLGNSGPLLLNPNLWRAPGFLNGRKTSTELSGGVGGVNVTQVTMIHSFRIGGAEFKDVPTTLMGDESAGARSGLSQGNVGLPLLSRFRLITDFAHDRVLFAGPIDTSPFGVDRSGLDLQPTPAGAAVVYVAPGSPAAAAGLKTGDVIVKVDGGPVQPNGAAGFARWRDGPAGQVLHLQTQKGEDRTVTLAAYF